MRRHYNDHDRTANHHYDGTAQDFVFSRAIPLEFRQQKRLHPMSHFKQIYPNWMRWPHATHHDHYDHCCAYGWMGI